MENWLDSLRQAARHGARRYFRTPHRWLVFRRAMRYAARTPAGVALPPVVIADLIHGWSNEFSAQEEFLRGLMAEAAGSEHGMEILECGSGLSTLLLGIVAQKTGGRVWSLENDQRWARSVQRALRRYRIDCVNLRHLPLRSYGTFDWYDLPRDWPPVRFSLVICDGPPGRTPGGRYGLLPLMHRSLAEGCAILFDDAARPGEQQVLERWAAEFHAKHQMLGVNKPYARVTLPPVRG